MQPTIKNILVITLLYLLASCTKDFLNDNLTQETLPAGSSNIYISPDWSNSAYVFKLPSVKEGDYEITSKPSWLNISSVNGHISDSIGVVQCSATKNTAFSTTGIYTDFITVKTGEKNYKVPVAYINEGNPVAQVQNTLTLSYNNNGSPYLQVHNNGLGILLWNIISMPNWLELDTAHVVSQGLCISPYTTYNIPLLFNPGNASSGNLTGKIVLSTNDKAHPSITINVTADLGTPQMSVSTNTLNFSYTETSKPLTLNNYGNGKLIWEFTDIPEWLTITPSSGTYNSYTSYGNIIFNCDRTKLSPGQNTATVNLKTNDSSHPIYNITVTAFAAGITKNIQAINGIVVDAIFNKTSNILYYVTSAPNKFISYDVIGRTILNEIPLTKAPTCFAISEDWTKAAIGHNGFISSINISGNSLTSTYTVDYSVNDIAWAENDWFSYTQKGGSFSALHWINTANGNLYDDTDKYSLDGSSIVKKVPNQPYLIATRNSTSPSGFFAYDIATKSKKSYAHMDLTNFWFSENGDYIFARNLNIYRTTSSTGATSTFNADINAIGKINIGTDNYYGLQNLYHGNNYLWVIRNESYSSDASSTLYQVEDNDYTLVKKIVYDLLYQPDAQTNPFTVSANYVFANKEGTEIAVLCKGISNNSWIIQFITVK